MGCKTKQTDHGYTHLGVRMVCNQATGGARQVAIGFTIATCYGAVTQRAWQPRQLQFVGSVLGNVSLSTCYASIGPWCTLLRPVASHHELVYQSQGADH